MLSSSLNDHIMLWTLSSTGRGKDGPGANVYRTGTNWPLEKTEDNANFLYTQEDRWKMAATTTVMKRSVNENQKFHLPIITI